MPFGARRRLLPHACFDMILSFFTLIELDNIVWASTGLFQSVLRYLKTAKSVVVLGDSAYQQPGSVSRAEQFVVDLVVKHCQSLSQLPSFRGSNIDLSRRFVALITRNSKTLAFLQSDAHTWTAAQLAELTKCPCIVSVRFGVTDEPIPSSTVQLMHAGSWPHLTSLTVSEVSDLESPKCLRRTDLRALLVSEPPLPLLSLELRNVNLRDCTHLGRFQQLTHLVLDICSGLEANDSDLLSLLRALTPLSKLTSLVLWIRNQTLVRSEAAPPLLPDWELPVLCHLNFCSSLDLARLLPRTVVPQLETAELVGTKLGGPSLPLSLTSACNMTSFTFRRHDEAKHSSLPAFTAILTQLREACALPALTKLELAISTLEADNLLPSFLTFLRPLREVDLRLPMPTPPEEVRMFFIFHRNSGGQAVHRQ